MNNMTLKEFITGELAEIQKELKGNPITFNRHRLFNNHEFLKRLIQKTGFEYQLPTWEKLVEDAK